MTMYDYVWLCMTMYDHVWPCMTMYDYVWLCMTLYDYVWLFTTLHGYVWICMTISEFECLYMIIIIIIFYCQTQPCVEVRLGFDNSYPQMLLPVDRLNGDRLQRQPLVPKNEERIIRSILRQTQKRKATWFRRQPQTQSSGLPCYFIPGVCGNDDMIAQNLIKITARWRCVRK